MCKRMSFETQFCKDCPPKMCLKTNIDKRIHNSGFLLYAEDLNFIFFHKRSTSYTFVLKILAEMCL